MTPNLSPNNKDETFSLEIFKYDKINVSATINKQFYRIRNHVGDIRGLTKIYNRIENTSEKRKEKDEIKYFKKLIRFGFEHLSKACTDEEAKKFNSSFMMVKKLNFSVVLV